MSVLGSVGGALPSPTDPFFLLESAMRYLLALFLTSCAAFSQQPKPVGEPGPVACVGAQSAAESWRLLDIYMRQVLEAQTVYSCAPVAPPPATAPAVPALR